MLNIPFEFIRQFHFVRNMKLMQLYITISLATLSLSLIGLFIPIFLMKEIGYSFGSVMLFMIEVAAFSLVTFPLALKLSSRIGMNKTAMLSVPVRVSFLLLLNALHFWHVPLILIAFLSNLGAAMFWLPYHIRFAQTSDHDHRGSELGMRYLLEGLAAVSGPVLGGILATTLGFKWLYIIASFILALSVIPLFFMGDMKVGKGFKLIDVLKRKSHTDLIGYMAEGYRTNAYTLWSLFLFFFVGSYVTLGGISSLVSLANSVFQVFAGYVSDSFSKKGMLRFGIAFDSVSWFVRTLFTSVYSMFAATIVGSIAIAVWYMPYSSKYYDKMSESDGISHILFRELGLSLGAIVLFLFAMVFGLQAAVISAGVVVYLILMF